MSNPEHAGTLAAVVITLVLLEHFGVFGVRHGRATAPKSHTAT